jgi:hypothetical protein
MTRQDELRDAAKSKKDEYGAHLVSSVAAALRSGVLIGA